MNSKELHDMILGENRSRPRMGRDAHFSLTGSPAGTGEGRFLLNFECRVKGLVHLLLLDENGAICLQTDHLCKSGHNQIRLDLTRYPAGRYQVDLLSADHIETCTLVR